MTDAAPDPPRALPPGQRLVAELPVHHYGPVPKHRPESWKFMVFGATLDGQEHHLDTAAFAALPRITVTADFHCVSRWSVLDNVWEGVAAREVIDRFPPAEDVTHVLVYAEYGYSATIGLEDLASPRTLLATHLDDTTEAASREDLLACLQHLVSAAGNASLMSAAAILAPEFPRLPLIPANPAEDVHTLSGPFLLSPFT